MRVLAPCLALALAAAVTGCEDREEPLPVLVTVPDFALVAADGQPFRGEDMDGGPWIADFIFTSCKTFCPVLTERLASVRERLREAHGERAPRFLSVSVDPEHDTPEVLREYARRHGVVHGDWVFTTGDTASVSKAVVKGFRAPMGEPVSREDGDGYDILHARHFVLIDGARRIRGYYRPEPEQLDRLVSDAGRLVGEDGAAP